jgi:predicted metal-dependent hydrolase
MPDILVRHLQFDFEEDKDVDAEIIPGDPEMSFFMVGLSVILPYLEPHLVKHMIAGQKRITDKVLLHDMQQFVRQEAAHYKEHKRFNDRVRVAYPGLAQLEAEVAADYLRFSEKGLKFNLAYAEGFESLTQPYAIFMWESGMIKQMKGPLADIYTWHVLEEIEHRTVAFDAYYCLHNDYIFRFRVSLIAQYHLIRFMMRCAIVMLKQENGRFKQRGGWTGRTKRTLKWIGLACKYLLPQLLKTYLPRYDPRNLKVPSVMTELTETYNARAYKITR